MYKNGPINSQAWIQQGPRKPWHIAELFPIVKFSKRGVIAYSYVPIGDSWFHQVTMQSPNKMVTQMSLDKLNKATNKIKTHESGKETGREERLLIGVWGG